MQTQSVTADSPVIHLRPLADALAQLIIAHQAQFDQFRPGTLAMRDMQEIQRHLVSASARLAHLVTRAEVRAP